MYNPSYLSLSDYNVYTFRWPFPSALCPSGSRRYLKLSLKTRDPKLALHLSSGLSYLATKVTNSRAFEGMDFKEVKAIVQTYMQRALEHAKRQLDERGAVPAEIILNKTLAGQYSWQPIRSEFPDVLDDDDKEQAAFIIPRICKTMGLPEIDETDPEWTLMSQAYKQALPQYSKAWLKHLDSLNDYNFQVEPVAVEAIPVISKVQALSSALLGEVIEKYVAAHVRDNVWDDNTRANKKAILAVLVELLGNDFALNELDSKKAREVRDSIKSLPRNRNKSALVRDLSLQEALTLPDVERISPVTVANYYNTIRSMFDWCVSEDYVARNPFALIKVNVDRKRKKSERTAFSPEQVQVLHTAVTNQKKHYRYWGTLLGIYTGARLNEICQLELDDIQQEDGIWFFNMNDEGDTKKLKTAAAKRKVPVHKELILLGLLEERTRLKAQGHKRFLHELTHCKKNGYGKKLGHYFNQVLLPELGIKQHNNNLVFHALRHTAVTRLYQAGVSQPIVETLVGHERSGTSQQVYFQEGYKLSQLKQALDQYDPLS